MRKAPIMTLSNFDAAREPVLEISYMPLSPRKDLLDDSPSVWMMIDGLLMPDGVDQLVPNV
jgi:hypothetical protein